LLKLGIEISERTVSRLMPKNQKPPFQTWRAFLNNHVQDLVSIDFFTVPILHGSDGYLSRPVCLGRAGDMWFILM
jgi:hypothetical protein